MIKNLSIKNNAIILLIIFIITTSCKPGVEIMFTNESKENFKTLKVDIGRKDTIFQNVESGKSTKPFRISGSYSYCYAQVITEKDTISFVPIDFMGERYYKSGKLKMKLKIFTDEKGKRHLDFVD